MENFPPIAYIPWKHFPSIVILGGQTWKIDPIIFHVWLSIYDSMENRQKVKYEQSLKGKTIQTTN